MIPENFGRTANFIELAGELVAAYVSNNPVPASELPNLIQTVRSVGYRFGQSRWGS